MLFLRLWYWNTVYILNTWKWRGHFSASACCVKKTQKQSRTRTCHKTQYAVQTKPKLYINTPPPSTPFFPPTTWPKQCQGSSSSGPMQFVKFSSQDSNRPLLCSKIYRTAASSERCSAVWSILLPMWRLNSKLCSQTGSYSEILVYLGKGVKNSQQSLTFHSSQTSHSGWVPRGRQLQPLAGWRCSTPPACAKNAFSSQNLCLSRKFGIRGEKKKKDQKSSVWWYELILTIVALGSI